MVLLPAVVETPRLTVRHWSEGDAVALSVAITESLDHLRPWMAWISDEPLNLEERVSRIRRDREEWEQGGDSVFGVFRDGVVVGACGLHRRGAPDTIEIGYWIHVDHLRQGYATEVAQGLTDAAFEVPAIAQVEIRHDKANAASARIPERLGFVKVEELVDEIAAPGEVGVEVVWANRRP
jgi:RimJ/RimL family protein N-acetyltransferase